MNIIGTRIDQFNKSHSDTPKSVLEKVNDKPQNWLALKKYYVSICKKLRVEKKVYYYIDVFKK